MADYYNNGIVLEQANEITALRAELEQAKGTIALQRAWIEKAGHRPGCAALRAEVPEGWHESDDVGPDVVILPGPCDCGWEELVGG